MIWEMTTRLLADWLFYLGSLANNFKKPKIEVGNWVLRIVFLMKLGCPEARCLFLSAVLYDTKLVIPLTCVILDACCGALARFPSFCPLQLLRHRQNYLHVGRVNSKMPAFRIHGKHAVPATSISRCRQLQRSDVESLTNGP
jgi:hypothetical protein